MQSDVCAPFWDMIGYQYFDVLEKGTKCHRLQRLAPPPSM
jgi:hypothetical protein